MAEIGRDEQGQGGDADGHGSDQPRTLEVEDLEVLERPGADRAGGDAQRGVEQVVGHVPGLQRGELRGGGDGRKRAAQAAKRGEREW